MSKLTTAAKRLLVGRPFRSDRLSHTLLPKRIALPVFASDALSSVAYAPQEIFAVLSVAGLAAYAYAPWIAGAGLPGDDRRRRLVPAERARLPQRRRRLRGGHARTWGRRFGLLVASALLVDYILTVAVSTAAGVANIGSAIQIVGDHPVWFSIGIIVLVCAANLRGIRESGAAFAIPIYAFIVSMFAMIITGLVAVRPRRRPAGARARSTSCEAEGAFTGLALVFLLLRGVLVRLGGADRRRGDLQRRAGVQEAEVEERRDHAGADGGAVGDDDARPGRADPDHRRALRRRPGSAS